MERRPDSGALALMRFWISLNFGCSLSATSCSKIASLVVTMIPVRARRWNRKEQRKKNVRSSKHEGAYTAWKRWLLFLKLPTINKGITGRIPVLPNNAIYNTGMEIDHWWTWEKCSTGLQIRLPSWTGFFPQDLKCSRPTLSSINTPSPRALEQISFLNTHTDLKGLRKKELGKGKIPKYKQKELSKKYSCTNFSFWTCLHGSILVFGLPSTLTLITPRDREKLFNRTYTSY